MSHDRLHRHPAFASIAFALTGLIVVGQIYLPIPILRDIAHQFGTDPDTASWTTSSFSFAYAAGFLISGPLSDYFGRRRVMLTGFTLMLLLTALTSLATDMRQLLVGRTLQGLVASAFPPLILAYLGESMPAAWKTRAISFMSLGFLTASLLAQLYAITLQRWPFGQIEQSLLPAYLIALTVIFFFVEDRDGTHPQRSLLEIYRRLPSLLLERRLKWLYLSTLCTLSALVAFYLLLDARFGHAIAQAGIPPIATRLVALPAMALSLATPTVIRRVGALALIRRSFAIASLGILFAAGAALTGSAWGVLAASIVFIGGRSFSVPALVGAISALAEPASRGTAIALYTFVLFVGASLGPWLAQVLAFFSYPASLLLLALIAGLPVLFGTFLRKEAA